MEAQGAIEAIREQAGVKGQAEYVEATVVSDGLEMARERAVSKLKVAGLENTVTGDLVGQDEAAIRRGMVQYADYQDLPKLIKSLSVLTGRVATQAFTKLTNQLADPDCELNAGSLAVIGGIAADKLNALSNRAEASVEPTWADLSVPSPCQDSP